MGNQRRELILTAYGLGFGAYGKTAAGRVLPLAAYWVWIQGVWENQRRGVSCLWRRMGLDLGRMGKQRRGVSCLWRRIGFGFGAHGNAFGAATVQGGVKT